MPDIERPIASRYTLNFFQSIALVGVIISGVAHLGLWLFGKQVHNFVLLYPTWVAVFLLGTVIKAMKMDQLPPHQHDHHHEHPEEDTED